MPPWSADPKHGECANDPRLSQKEIDTIVAWVNAGAPKGDDKDMPPAPKFTEGWTIGKPDVVLEMQEEYTVPADGTVPYLYFTMPTNFTEDKWIQAMEIRPGNRSVVHHVIAYSQEPGARPSSGEGELRSRPHAPRRHHAEQDRHSVRDGIRAADQEGKQHRLPDALHHQRPGRPRIAPRSASSSPKSRRRRRLMTATPLNARFVIPPGDPNYEVKSSKTFNEDVHDHVVHAAHARARQRISPTRRSIPTAVRRSCSTCRSTTSTGS